MIDIPKDIPNKHEFSQLKKQDKAIVAFAVLMGVSNQEAFMRYNPHYMRADGKGMNEAGVQASRQFWGWGKVKDYRAEYEKVVEEYINGNKIDNSFNTDETIDGDALARKILSDLAAMIKNGRIQDYEVLKVVTDILNKYGLLKGSEEKTIPPIRVLMARCKSECNYCFFIETAKAKRLIFDSCDYCKARKIAEEHGFKFDHCTLLEVPADVVAEFERENNVDLMDIINNGQQTRADIESELDKVKTNGNG